MAIPKTYRKELSDALVAENIKVALFTSGGWAFDATNVNHHTYDELKTLFTEVSAVGTGYTTGGYALNGDASSYVGATNVTIFTANVTSVPSATFTCRYAVFYETTSGNNLIRDVKDLGGDIPVSSGTLTITWDNTNGILKFS